MAGTKAHRSNDEGPTEVSEGERQRRPPQQHRRSAAGRISSHFVVLSIMWMSFIIQLILFPYLYCPVDAKAVTERVIDAETGADCIDSDPVNCPYWAATGECRANRSYMHVHCKKSCDRCKVVRVRNRDDINRYMEDKKREIEEMKKIRKQKKEAMEVLKWGAGLGSSGKSGNDSKTDNSSADGDDSNKRKETTTAKLPTPPSQDSSEDKSSTTESSTVGVFVERGDARVLADVDPKKLSGTEAAAAATTTNAKTNTDDSVAATAEQPNPQEKAAKSVITTASLSQRKDNEPKKKKAKIDAETGLECVDLDDNCPFWAMTGDCKTNRNFMSRNCRLSCDRCHIVRVNNHDEMQNFIDRKKKEVEIQRGARNRAREVQKILSGEL